MKNPHTNTENVLTIKFHNNTIYFNFITNEVKGDLISVYLLYYTFIRRRQDMLHSLN